MAPSRLGESMPPQLIAALISLQIVAFGWRLNREITQADNRRITWLPLPDYLNLASLLAVVTVCVIMPATGALAPRAANTALSVAYVLIAFHPINEAAHYRLLFSKEGRTIYRKMGRDIPWVTDQEIFTVIISAVLAAIAGCETWHSIR
ncbi:MAG: hypothetical protein LAO20_00985 [Acidobacteriia bacterium]|nr:hypothetical protein [Terriglobia bacterium]